jgi:hypothetical protein
MILLMVLCLDNSGQNVEDHMKAVQVVLCFSSSTDSAVFHCSLLDADMWPGAFDLG